jgi:hypothetical protein
MSSLEQCLHKCEKYKNNPKCVFTSESGIIIVLKKCKNTKTNEHRTVTNHLYAKYEGSKFKVIELFRKEHPFEELNHWEIVTVVRNYTHGKTKVTYYKSVEAAYYNGMIHHLDGVTYSRGKKFTGHH